MKIGTKSVLLGAHCFFLHPLFVFAAWWKLYGFPYDPRLWVAFFVHDLGYWGKPNMDGEEGELHPYFGAEIMQRFFDRKERKWQYTMPIRSVPREEQLEVKGWRVQVAVCLNGDFYEVEANGSYGQALAFKPTQWRKLQTKWYLFTLYHSRFLAKKNGAHFSKLCVADKLAIALTPHWLYLPMVNLTGEINEYMKLSKVREAGGEQKNANMEIDQTSQKKWYFSVQEYMRKWVAEHKDLRPDTWTPDTAQKQAIDENGTYK